MRSIRLMVFDALENAVTNGDDPCEQTIDEIVHDLLSYDGDLENYSASVIEPFVAEWVASHAGREPGREQS